MNDREKLLNIRGRGSGRYDNMVGEFDGLRHHVFDRKALTGREPLRVAINRQIVDSHDDPWPISGLEKP